MTQDFANIGNGDVALDKPARPGLTERLEMNLRGKARFAKDCGADRASAYENQAGIHLTKLPGSSG